MNEWHIITCEYPPQVGGVSDYTHLLASALAVAGDHVHVWCSPAACDSPAAPGVVVHRDLGRFTPGDLRCVGKKLDEFPAPRRLLVQWVPHGYGYRSMNLYFCAWLWKRAAFHHDRVEIMVHEPFLSFARGSFKQNAAATFHRVMTPILMRAASRVWVSIPAWEKLMRPYAPARAQFSWLPIPSTVTPVDDCGATSTIRERFAPPGFLLLGHLGTYGVEVKRLLAPVVIECLRSLPATTALFMGYKSDKFSGELASQSPELANRIHGTGYLANADLSRHVASCDLMVQPYPDGVSSRRTSLMVALSHGIPAVGTTGSLTEALWAESGAVALAPAGDVAAMVKLTEQLLTHKAERQRLGAAAKALYQQRFDLGRTIATLRTAGSSYSEPSSEEEFRCASQ
jgi:glycosyltransferase involved in cell wall biosynthesis